jgi:peptidoglycan/LPS O-acetylase OafA/YrhL
MESIDYDGGSMRFVSLGQERVNEHVELCSLPINRQPGYRADVDGLRAVAVISVIIFHINPSLLPGGFVGVDVFFVISGYLISGIIFRQLSHANFSCADFYARRVKRIFPALIVVLAVTWACGWLSFLPDEFSLLGKEIVAGATFSLNLSVYEDHQWYFVSGALDPLLHLWSLSVEEQFYILWPLFLLSIWRFERNRFLLMISITFISFTLNIVAVSSDPLASYYLPWNRLWELSSGGLLAYIEKCNRIRTRLILSTRLRLLNACNLRGVIGASVLTLSFVGLDGSGKTAFPGWWGLLPSIGALLLISAGRQSWINRNLLATRAAVFTGLISYPLYLWHLPLLASAGRMGWKGPATSVGAVAVAVLLSVITYKCVELPVRSSRAKILVVASLSAMMIACASLGYITLAGIVPGRAHSYPSIEPFTRAGMEDWLPSMYPPDGIPSSFWTLTVEGFLTLGSGPQRVLFIGDSYVQQYYQRISKILTDHPRNPRGAVFAVRASCVPGGVELLHHRLPESYVVACREFLQSALNYSRSPVVDRIVIGGSWYSYFAARHNSRHNYGEDASLTPWKPGSEYGLNDLQRTLTELARDGKQVYLILSHPTGLMFDPHQMIKRRLLAPAFALQVQELVPRTQISNADGIIAARLRHIATEAGAQVIDPTDFFCEKHTCRAVTPTGEPMYRDGGHLRPSYVRENVRFLDAIVLEPDAESADTAPAIAVGDVRRQIDSHAPRGSEPVSR